MSCIYAVLLAGGFFRSLQFTGFNSIAFADIPAGRMSAATSFYSTAQQLSITMGVAAGAAALQMSATFFGYPEPLLVDYSAAFLVVAVLAAASVPVSMRLAEDAGAELSGQRAAAE